MSNRLHIIPTEFRNIRSGEISIGWRAYDDDQRAFDCWWDDMPADDCEFLKRVINCGDGTLTSMLEFMSQREDGLFIGDNWYPYEEIQPILEEMEEAEEED